MFSSRSKDTVPVAQPTPAPKRGRALSAPSIIGADMVIQGTVQSSGDVQIDGRLQGDIRSAGLVIGDQAEVHGEIYAEELTVRGKVVGRIHARKVMLTATSRVEGDILHEAFAVESGAFFEGNIRHSDNPLGDAVPAGGQPPSFKSGTPGDEPADTAGLFTPVSRVAT